MWEEWVVPAAPFKYYAYDEAMWEVQGLHDYVNALALHGVADGNGLYAAAAFDMTHANFSSAVAGANDWLMFTTSQHCSFIGPQFPLVWGAPLFQVHGTHFKHV